MSNITHINGKPIGPTFTYTFEWEFNFDYEHSRGWFYDNRHIPCFIAVCIYLPILYIGTKLMQNRAAFQFKRTLLIWNASLALFSICGALRTVPELFYTFEHFGFYHTVCNTSFVRVKPGGFWVWLFVLSKVPELGDTMFLVIRKQKLIFLHVYHHASVLIFAWYVYACGMASARWFCTMNYTVHAMMYSYYALKAMPHIIYIPKWVSMIITGIQTIQMIIGASVILAAYWYKLSGRPCETTGDMVLFGVFIYTTYMLLFMNFFLSTYCNRKPVDAEVDKQQAKTVAKSHRVPSEVKKMV